MTTDRTADVSWVWDELPNPRDLGTDWHVHEVREDGYCADWCEAIRVIASGQVTDGKRWLHVSVSRRAWNNVPALPSWADLKLAQKLFLRGRKAIQILPGVGQPYVNKADVLHLWHCLDGDGLPEFAGENGDL